MTKFEVGDRVKLDYDKTPGPHSVISTELKKID